MSTPRTECWAFLPEQNVKTLYRAGKKAFKLLADGFRYHHADQLGSASMKAVLPALTGRGYDHLEIRDGGTASLEFLRVTFGDVPEAERQRVRQALNQYCALDTMGMVDIVDALRRLAG